MHRIPLLFALALTCILGLSVAQAQAADVAIFPPEAPNLAPNDAVALGELLAQSYAASSRAVVLSPAHTLAALASGTYEQAAVALGVRDYVRTHAVAVGRRIVVSATRHASDGTTIHRVRMTADSPEDLIPVCERIAFALYLRSDDSAVRGRQNVTLTEARRQNRLWRETLTGVRSTLQFPFVRGADYSPHVGAMFDLRMEFDRYFLEFGAGITLPARAEDLDPAIDEQGNPVRQNRGSVAGLMAEIGASRFLTQGNTGLYLGAGAIPGITFTEDLAAFALYTQLGVSLPRDSSTRFSADLRFSQAVLGQTLNDGRRVFPSQPSLHAGVAW
jgi:hypothetical protein